MLAYRGTERPGLGENESDVNVFMKDLDTVLIFRQPSGCLMTRPPETLCQAQL